MTSRAASIRLAAKWPWIQSRKKALGTPTSSESSRTPSRTPSPNQSPNRDSPSRSAIAARNVDSTPDCWTIGTDPLAEEQPRADDL